jgi:hypothetical protein
MRHGFTPEGLQKLSCKIAYDGCRRRGAMLQDRMDDLVSRLTIAGLEALRRYDPERHQASYGSNGGDPVLSYISDIMDARITDYFRCRSEGFGDRRYGNDNRIVLDDDPDPADHDTDFELLVDDRRRARWQEAADATGWPLSEWIAIALDRYAEAVLKAA